MFGLPAQQLAPNGQGGGLGLGLRAQQLAPDDQGWWWYLASTWLGTWEFLNERQSGGHGWQSCSFRRGNMSLGWEEIV